MNNQLQIFIFGYCHNKFANFSNWFKMPKYYVKKFEHFIWKFTNLAKTKKFLFKKNIQEQEMRSCHWESSGDIT